MLVGLRLKLLMSKHLSMRTRLLNFLTPCPEAGRLLEIGVVLLVLPTRQFTYKITNRTGDILAVSKGELVVEKSSKPVVDVVREDARSVPSEVRRSGIRFQSIAVPSLDVGDENTFDLCSHIQKQRAENAGLLFCRAENQKVQTDTLLKLFTETKMNGVLEYEVNLFTQQLAEVLTEHEKGFIDRRGMEISLASINKPREKI